MIYDVLLTLHSVLRWLVLVAGAAAVVQAVVGLAGRGDFEKRHKLSNLAFLVTMDTQLLLGFALYLGVSPLMTEIFQDFGAAMKDGDLRFWAVEHLTGMLVAVVLVHVGYFVAKRARKPARKHLWAALGMGLGLLAVLGSIPWASRPLLRLGL
jgi:hypothetical protein